MWGDRLVCKVLAVQALRHVWFPNTLTKARLVAVHAYNDNTVFEILQYSHMPGNFWTSHLDEIGSSGLCEKPCLISKMKNNIGR